MTKPQCEQCGRPLLQSEYLLCRPCVQYNRERLQAIVANYGDEHRKWFKGEEFEERIERDERMF